jgi:UDP-N-acetylglucosamine--N-acetylmuramyl-(pentapeptide) pyrophosphoryl-undecaprenol N-acetylglucosamine transferase
MSPKRPRVPIVITGNHHTPAIELINQLQSDQKYQWQIYYVSQTNPNETHLQKTIIPLLKDKYFNLNSGKFDRNNLLKTLRNIPKIIQATLNAFFLLRRLHPRIVVSFGGYISVPVVVASSVLHIPSITHEQTLTISLSTLLNSLFCTKIALSFTPLNNHYPLFLKNKSEITGNLLRQSIFDSQSARFDHLKTKLIRKPLILFLGGNQGAKPINQHVQKLLPKLLKNYFVIHQTGPTDYPAFQKLDFPGYYPLEYIGQQDIGWVFRHAKLIISRSGANTCQEIDALNKKAIFVPLPFSQQNEQLLNAKWVQSRHPQTTYIIDQNQLTPKLLYKQITSLISTPDSRPASFSPNHSFLNLIHQTVKPLPT